MLIDGVWPYTALYSGVVPVEVLSRVGQLRPVCCGRYPMKRREFIGLLGWTTAWVSAVRAQEPRQVIGFLTGFRFPGSLVDVGVPAFLQGLKDAGL
jgi:hypothetical protein